MIDRFNRKHSYLRISITERCNLRCTYCMPEEGVLISQKDHLMNAEEIYEIASKFVKMGVTKIRLTGGEPLVRKEARAIIRSLASLPITLSLTTNAITVDQFIDLFKEVGIKSLNVSLDSLDRDKFFMITRRDYFDRVFKNINLLLDEGFAVKINAVAIKGFNDNEIIDFIELTKHKKFNIRFIEFMPFDGNKWNFDKIVSYQDILDQVNVHYKEKEIIRLDDEAHDTSRNFKIKGYEGQFAIISSVTNPFCDTCNRIRLTANGRLKNCLFSNGETDLLTPFRNGVDIEPIINETIIAKHKMRGGMDTLEKLKEPSLNSNNRSMITIGG